jgi:hypothetical protein
VVWVKVYLATDTKLGRSVGIKLLSGAVTDNTSNNLRGLQSFSHRSNDLPVCVKKQHLGKATPVVGFSLRVGYSQFVAPRNPRQLWQRTA